MMGIVTGGTFSIRFSSYAGRRREARRMRVHDDETVLTGSFSTSRVYFHVRLARGMERRNVSSLVFCELKR